MSTHVNYQQIVEDAREALIQHYQSITPDVAAFRRTINTPLPMTFWLNPLKINRADFEKICDKKQLAITQLAWNPAAFQAEDSYAWGRSWHYMSGLIQIQEAVSMLVGQVLAPQAHETILDMCAAPGNKTAQLAVAMQNTGLVLANDCSYGRLRAFGQIAKRLGLINVASSVYDGIHFPNADHSFDKILVDAPCSCEGTLRKNIKKVIQPNLKNSLRLANIQLALLRRALKLCKQNGLILYSTCTFAPEENEAIVSKMLYDYANQLEIVPIDIPNFYHSPGLLKWHDQTYHPETQHAVRIWPQQNNTGGFFLALFRKKTGQPTKINNTTSEVAPLKPAHQQLVKNVIGHYGFPHDVFKNFQFVDASTKGIYIRNKASSLANTIKLDAAGLFFMKTNTNFPKLTTAAAMVFGQAATRNIVEIGDAQLTLYYGQETFTLTKHQAQHCTKTGFVIVRYQQYILGTALYLSALDDQPPRLCGLFPKYLLNQTQIA